MKEKDVNYKSLYEIACWANDIRGTKLTLFDGWHYNEYPFYDGIRPDETFRQLHPKHNSTYIIEDFYNVINKTNTTFFKSFMLRFFIHLVGDMHQPLHMTTRYTGKLRKGDDFGKLYPLQGDYKNLHALWDHAMGKIADVGRVIFFHYAQPLTKSGVHTIEKWTKEIMEQYTRAKLAKELNLKNPYTMSVHVHKYAISHAYKDITEGGVPSDYYKDSRFEVCKALIALAGYRLADYLNSYFLPL